MSHYVHHVPGRLRVRTANLKRKPAAAAAVRERLMSSAGVRSAEVNVVTGSVTVTYDVAAINPHALLDILRESGHLGGGVAFAEAANALEEGAARMGQAVAKAAAAMIFEKVVERSAVALIGALI